MNNKLKAVLWFVAGAVCGAGGCWYFVNKHYQEKFQKESSEFEEYVLKTHGVKKNVGNMGVTEKSERVAEAAYKSHVNAEKQLIESYKESIPLNGTSYNSISSNNGASAESKVEVKEPTDKPSAEPKEDAPEEDEERDPYLISVEEYGDIEPYYDKIALIFDQSDDTLIDASNNELMDPVETIGMNVYEKLDKFRDGTYLYVRNDKISCDYEIEVRDFSDVNM